MQQKIRSMMTTTMTHCYSVNYVQIDNNMFCLLSIYSLQLHATILEVQNFRNHLLVDHTYPMQHTFWKFLNYRSLILLDLDQIILLEESRCNWRQKTIAWSLVYFLKPNDHGKDFLLERLRYSTLLKD